jgi:nucleotide-binding universal stress UspA family protein
MHVVVGYNGTPAATAALQWAVGAGRRLDADLSVVWVLPAAVAWELAVVQIDPGKRRDQMERQLQKACDEHCPPDVTCRARVVEGSPTAVLRRDGARPGASMIVIGASHRGAVGDLIMGSVAHDLAHAPPAPVVVVPPDARSA